MSAPSQLQLCNQAHRKVADTNDHFLWLIENGMTREDLEKCIARRPSLWQRFENWLSVLPTCTAVNL